jgi:hypothetical protein
LPHFIKEHAPLDLANPVGWATVALAAVYLVTLIGIFPRWPRTVWLVPLAWFVLAVLRVRNAPLFGVTAVIAVADMLPYSRVGRWLEWHELLGQPSPPAPFPKGEGRLLNSLLLPVVVVAAAAMLQLAGIRVLVVGRDWARFDSARCPIELLPTLDKINDSSVEGTHIFNDLNFGGFLIYHAPPLRVFVDDRCPLYGTKFLLAYEHARREDPAQIDRWRRQYGFDYALVETGGRFDGYLSSSDGWNLVERSPAAALYRHE